MPPSKVIILDMITNPAVRVFDKVRPRTSLHIPILTCATALLFLMGPLAAATPPDVELQASVRVRTAAASPIAVGTTAQSSGEVAALRKATVAAEVAGRVVRRVVEAGDLKDSGALLLELDDTNAQLALRQAQASAKARQADLAHARHEYQRSSRLLQRKVVSQDTVDDLRFAQAAAAAQYDAAQANVAVARKAVADAQVVAPFAGQIEQVHVQVGDFVNPGQPVVTLTDFSAARVIVGVSTGQANTLRTGVQTTITSSDLGGQPVAARITSVGRIKDAVSGTYPVELRIDQLNNLPFREGMVVQVRWPQTDAQQVPLSVPGSALMRQSDGIYVFTVEQGSARLTQVRIGKSDGQRVEILEGLSQGDQVVIEGLFALRDGAPVEVVQSILPSTSSRSTPNQPAS